MIQLKNLTKKYKELTVFNNTNFEFTNTGLTCILGESGCGKSTLLNMLAGFDSGYSGDIIVCEEPINKMNAQKLCEYRRNNIGFIFQNYHLLKGYTVLENILLACELEDSNKEQNIKNAKELLRKLGLENKTDEKIENLSGGQKQRVAIARALLKKPKIILADEPTGALDRENSNEIMKILKEISKKCLVIVITHDSKICCYADEIIHIKDAKIISEEIIKKEKSNNQNLNLNKPVKVNAFKRGLKNLKVHIKRYITISIAIAIGTFIFMMSLSSGNIIRKSIDDFKEKNTAFNNGYIEIKEDDKETNKVFEKLKTDNRIENVYYQYVLENVSLRFNNTEEIMKEKYPMPKATKEMSYGIMPKIEENQIALSPSLAKKFEKNINELLGKTITLNYCEKEYNLSVSGIFNEDYDDFFISSDIEQKIYENTQNKEKYSINYDVKKFEDIVLISTDLENRKIESKNAKKEVASLENTFNNLSKLFFIVSSLLLVVSIFISVVLLAKLQNSRYKEMGLLSALGFEKKTIRNIIVSETLLLSIMSTIFNILFMLLSSLISIVFDLNLMISVSQIITSIIFTLITTLVINVLISSKLINTEPAVALRK